MSQLHLVCPQCGAVNRVPAERLAQGPSCGKCKAALLPGVPVEVNAAMLAKLVARSDVPVLVDFWAPWCGPCRAMAPAFAGAAAKLKDAVLFVKCDTQANQDAGHFHKIYSIPTMALFKAGQEQDRISGALPESAIVDWARSRA